MVLEVNVDDGSVDISISAKTLDVRRQPLLKLTQRRQGDHIPVDYGFEVRNVAVKRLAWANSPYLSPVADVNE